MTLRTPAGSVARDVRVHRANVDGRAREDRAERKTRGDEELHPHHDSRLHHQSDRGEQADPDRSRQWVVEQEQRPEATHQRERSATNATNRGSAVPGVVEIVTVRLRLRFLGRLLRFTDAGDQPTQSHADGDGRYIEARSDLDGGLFEDEPVPQE